MRHPETQVFRFVGERHIYKVLIDDNFHYQDLSERVTHGVFGTVEEALAACREIVDASLADLFRPGMSSMTLYDYYVTFGDDPFIVPDDNNSSTVEFSAWDFARLRCQETAGVSGAGFASFSQIG